MIESWHSRFNPSQFLSKVNIDTIIKQNEIYNENKTNISDTHCILCNSKQGPGLLLNDKSYLCKACFIEVSTITYPEKYERLYREYIKNKEARRIARYALVENCLYRKMSDCLAIIAWVSLLFLLINYLLMIVPIALYFILLGMQSLHDNKLNKWEIKFPNPKEPQVRHFHDSKAKLTARDRTILKIFNNWPGYPPFWAYLRQVVIDKDGNRCQVSGCPSRVELHIHHKIPVAQGGEHIPTNLVALCSFHHALEPSEGHERIWGKIKTQYFTMVHAHKRRNTSTSGYHDVRAHVRRLELIGPSDIFEIIDFYGLSCPSCGAMNLKSDLDQQNQQITIICQNCNKLWTGPRKLSEETGPKIAELMTITKNKGYWKPRWDMLETRSDSTFRLLKKAGLGQRRKSKIKKSKTHRIPKCPKCGSTMKLIRPNKEQHWNAFWGCTKFRTTGCKGTREV